VIDPLVQVAFGIQSAPGVYALLLGSGVSRASGIKTGWEVLQDLCEKLAAASGEETGGKPTEWFAAKFGVEADYSVVLEHLAPTPAERQALLQSYFEPTEDERTQGIKTPNAAHRAVAQLVAKGYVRIIVTTNFDRLLEDALNEVGVRPHVVKSAADAAAAPPPAHSKCLLVKVHGDYLDTDLRNTVNELGWYEPAMDRLLDRILDDYGLIVCGWSADWDTALRTAIDRATNRRYTTYWTIRSSNPTPAAKALIDSRGAIVLTIQDAETFFAQLSEKIASIEDVTAKPPSSTALAIGAAKRYLADDAGRIRLHDLLLSEAERAKTLAASVHARPEKADLDEFEERASLLEASVSVVAPLVATVCQWGDERQTKSVSEALTRLLDMTPPNGLTHLIALRNYPASLVFSAAILGAIAAKKPTTVAALLRMPVDDWQGRDRTAVMILLPEDVLQGLAMSLAQKRRGTDQRFHLPANELVHDAVRPLVREQFPDDKRFEDAYDEYEGVAAMCFAQEASERRYPVGYPVGRLCWRNSHFPEGSLVARFSKQMDQQGDKWPYVAAGLIPSAERARELLSGMQNTIARRAVF
jgi:hypothetical protein